MFCLSVVFGIEWHIAFVDQGLLTEHLHQSGSIGQQFLVLQLFCEEFVVDVVAIKLACQFYQVE